ncbi:FliO/MopB family protein [Conexibacter arvalis]|uniref:Flagellar protein FliO/FliZ n=1 Tax=Conexibacter arvalis TaxID=912552 RepID=A0A840I7Z0_9ACTN|nr:flagellar biosynthetic protein FliO [Conexibacter arvalis]MBB4660986.1 flagellar protein FliO/FliZ [Conexibacter arvalis]
MIQASLLPRAAALAAALMIVLLAPALALAASDPEDTPVDLGTSTQPGADVGGSGGSLVRTIVGLAVVIGVIYGIAWVLRQVKQSRAERASGGLAAVASVPLGGGRSLQLVRAGNELVLVGVADHAVTPVRAYTEQEARDAGLIDEWGELVEPAEPVLAAAAAGGGAATARAPRDLVGAMRRWTVRR